MLMGNVGSPSVLGGWWIRAAVGAWGLGLCFGLDVGMFFRVLIDGFALGAWCGMGWDGMGWDGARWISIVGVWRICVRVLGLGWRL